MQVKHYHSCCKYQELYQYNQKNTDDFVQVVDTNSTNKQVQQINLQHHLENYVSLKICLEYLPRQKSEHINHYDFYLAYMAKKNHRYEIGNS